MVHVNLVKPILQKKILSEIGDNETCGSSSIHISLNYLCLH